MKLSGLLFFLLFAHAGFACLNGNSRELKNGKILYMDHQGEVPTGHQFYLEKDIRPLFREIDSLYKVTKDLDYLSDKALLLILLGKNDEAISIYIGIEEKEPGRYSTASNLGTAYELAGDNQNALKWIRRSVEIDPGSHHFSEWLHVNILEVKVKGDRFINSRSLIGTDFGSKPVPESKLSKDSLQNLSEALFYQINERMTFIKPKDKIVAQLLLDLGNVTFLLGNHWTALKDYGLAKEYGAQSEAEEKISATNAVIDRYYAESVERRLADVKRKSPPYIMYVSVGFGVIALIITGVMLFRKRR